MARRDDSALAALAQGFLRQHPEEAAQHLERARVTEVVGVVRGLPTAAAASVLDQLSADLAASVLERLEPEAAGKALEKLEPARASALLSRLEEPARAERLARVSESARRDLAEMLQHPPDSAGALMDPRPLALRPETTAGEALQRLRRARRAGLQELFVVDAEGRLLGEVPLAELAILARTDSLAAHVRPGVATVPVTAARDEVVETLGGGRIRAVAVVEFDNRLVGVLRHGALVAAVLEEASADIQTMVGASRDERALSPVTFAVRKRLPWLQVNLLTAFLAASVVGVFEGTIAKFTALAVLLPVVAGQSGNTGAQALAVTMRGLALREIRARQWLRVCGKEVRVAFLNGVAVAITTSAGVYVWSGSKGLALVIGLSMVLSMLSAGLSGAAIPMLLTALRQDPAQSSSIVLTTVTDVVGFFSFLGIATLFIGML